MTHTGSRAATDCFNTLPGAGPDGRLNETTPVLAFTADADADMVIRLTDAGFDGVVAKPVEPANLISTLLAAASGIAAPSGAEEPS